MKRLALLVPVIAMVTLTAQPSRANEGVFLRSLAGAWAGTGTVKVRTDARPIKVRCRFESTANTSSLDLNGKCTGLILISRAINSHLVSGGHSRYTGTYTGAGTGVAGLMGTRRGDAIYLEVRWAKNVNGDRSAQMILQKIGDDGLKLSTKDVDPKSGKLVTTSEINLRRSAPR
ncbi:hypothetical protein [Phyllobacterium endophyticum]|uniref:DUF1579 domain-containing protein n=1 Tax=Phyllobacterium endophyticum TaxID=1149773 RepID=A0A2P7ARR7_9HYPH|nr:hypothetical protein [Phyllobacterium endophyticum]MBB3236611.1 hypothetical protein [Phyllobacterium endophyticum]PSH56925.1 hypothetical protein CU100_16615 [Phyllobacterium endophyticum]TYR39605.1 hypothetical protein FY050_21255 [Phyllobacterium endophyticum]